LRQPQRKKKEANSNRHAREQKGSSPCEEKKTWERGIKELRGRNLRLEEKAAGPQLGGVAAHRKKTSVKKLVVATPATVSSFSQQNGIERVSPTKKNELKKRDHEGQGAFKGPA